MPDDLERQLEAFGATLAEHAGESITKGASSTTSAAPASNHRWWAIAGAAACVVAIVVGLVAVAGRDVEAPAAQPPAPNPTSTSPVVVSPVDADLLRTAPIAGLIDGCEPDDVLLTGDGAETDGAETGGSFDTAFEIAYDSIIHHTPPEVEKLPSDGWTVVTGDPVSVTYLNRGGGIEAIVRIRRDGDEWLVAEIAQCLPGRTPSAIQTTTVPAQPPEPVPDDPLALERDGWTLVERTTDPFAVGDLPCEAAQGLADFDGVPQVHDILTPPEGSRLDLDVQVVDVGSTDRGNDLATAVLAIGDCAADAEGVEVEVGSMSSVRATWFRAGDEFALVTVVGEGPRSIVLEIEGGPFDDDLIGELVHRADQFLRGSLVTGPLPSAGITVTDGPSLGAPQVEPVPGHVKLWVSNQSFADDPVAIAVAIDGTSVVDDSFEVGGQHNWFSFMIDGLAPGEHTLTATSDTGAVFEETFTLPPDEPLWMVVDYWCCPDDGEGRHFTFNVSDQPILFE
jgi:hypothetical protein